MLMACGPHPQLLQGVPLTQKYWAALCPIPPSELTLGQPPTRFFNYHGLASGHCGQKLPFSRHFLSCVASQI